MKEDINKFLTISRYKNGRVKISHDVDNEANIYKLLFKLGFRKATLNNRKILFQKTNDDLIPVKFDDIRVAFCKLLKNFEFENVPDYVNYVDILNWYYVKNPIKQNRLFNEYLSVELSKSEIHTLKLKTNVVYKHRNKINSILDKLNEWNFSKTIDKKATICINTTLYYKKN